MCHKISLDHYQKKVVKSKAKNLLVIAGAGSGKTLTIIYKIKHLMNQGFTSDEILCLSFTKASAEELQKKLAQENINLKVKTFHSLGYSIIKKKLDVSLAPEDILFKTIEKHLNKINLSLITDCCFISLGEDNLIELQNNILKNSIYYDKLKETIATFINLFKSHNYDISIFDKFLELNKKENLFYKQKKHHCFLKLVQTIITDYNNTLKKNKLIDYNDMINLATHLAIKQEFSYKYIIIDEYQDTSLNKCLLIKEIQKKTKSKLMAVGDDWQSIYQFTGSNLDIFVNFKHYFKWAKIIKLRKSYRNSYELLKITKKFIQKNPQQISKHFSTKKHNPYPICIYYYTKDIKEIWPKILNQVDINKTLVLGRNNQDQHLAPKNMQYLTIHKSKGLETDNVIVVNLTNKINSLPNKYTSSEYLKYVINKIDKYPFAEERRLFYVALTRAKSTTFLLVDKSNPSPFVLELIRDSKKYIKIVEKS